VPGGVFSLSRKREIKQRSLSRARQLIQAQLEVVGDPNSKLIKQIMMLPNASDDDRKKNARLRNIGDFYKAFGIPSVGKVNLASYFGNFGWAILTVEDGNEYGEQNRVMRSSLRY
jgi:hypothetical protein